MLRRLLISTALCVFALVSFAQKPIPSFVKHADGQYSLEVDGKPFFVLGGQSGNSNNWPAMHDQLFDTMHRMNANTLEVPIYWEAIEPVQGLYDMSSVKLIIDQARSNDIRLILLWFATWKNGSNHYMPEWMKLDSKKYFNVVGPDGRQTDSPSPHCKSAMELDAKAFTQVMRFIREYDSEHRTVIMMQVQNEPGSWDSVRDYSKSVDKLFAGQVPDALLRPEIFSQLETKAKSGTWSEVFGERADEYFHTWHLASYIEYVAAAGKAEYPLPMYVNAALRHPFGNPPATQYESGGPTDNVICIYKAAAPSIDFVAPDIYQGGDENYMESIRLYTRSDNALMVPETFSTSKYLYEVVSRGIGFSPFGVDGGRPVGPLADEYKMLAPIVDKLSKWRLEGRISTAIETADHAAKYLDLNGWQAVLTFGPPRRSNTQAEPYKGEPYPATGKAMLVELAPGDYYAFGTNVRWSFKPTGKNAGKAWHYLRVEEGSFDDNGDWKMTRVLNGDQTDWTGPYVGDKPTVLRIKVYVRETRK